MSDSKLMVQIKARTSALVAFKRQMAAQGYEFFAEKNDLDGYFCLLGETGMIFYTINGGLPGGYGYIGIRPR